MKIKNTFKNIKIKYIFFYIILIFIICFVVKNINFQKISVQVKNAREIKDYDFTKMGESFSDRIYEKYDTVKFGHYMQDFSGTIKEPIDWIVIEKQDNKVLLLSKYILELKEYNKEKNIITWENCTLRKWLNEDFFNIAFSNYEKKQIIEVINKNENHEGEIQADTKDKVFLLSDKDVRKYFENGYIYDSDMEMKKRIENGTFLASFDNASTKITDYLKRRIFLITLEGMMVEIYRAIIGEEGNGGSFQYWLRTPCSKKFDGEARFFDGALCAIESIDVTNSLNGVRPAIWVLLD